jgi:hypothetical protein
MTLNWRHKAGLFLTLVAVGCGLFLELSAKQAVGIALIGIAFSWLIGSSRRALRVAFAIGICAVGLYIAAAPVWSDWKSKKESAAEYEIGISDLQYAIKSIFRGTNIMDSPQGIVLTRFVTIPDSSKSWIRPEMADRTPGFPETMSGADVMQDLESSFLLPKPTFHLGSSVRAHAWSVLSGLALFTSGLSALGWLFRRTRLEQRQGSRRIASFPAD